MTCSEARETPGTKGRRLVADGALNVLNITRSWGNGKVNEDGAEYEVTYRWHEAETRHRRFECSCGSNACGHIAAFQLVLHVERSS